VGTALLVGDTNAWDPLQRRLSATGLTVDRTADLVAALERLDTHSYDAVVVAETARSPSAVADRLRGAGHCLPVVALVDERLPDTASVDAVVPATDPDAVVTRVEAVIDDRRLERQRTERRRLLDTIDAATESVHDATDAESGLSTLCRDLVGTGVYDVAWVGRYDGSGPVLDPVAAAGIPLDHLAGVPVAPGTETTAARAVDTGAVAVATDTTDAIDGGRPTVAVPLGDPPAAVLTLVGKRPAGVSSAERQALATLGDDLTPLFDDSAGTAGDRDGVTVLGDALGHELGNQLDIALTHLELARERGDDAHFAHVETALERMTDLAGEARLLASGEVDPQPVDLTVAAEAAWTTVETTDATLEVDAGTVEADPELLGLLLENLLRNAVEHGGPEVGVRVRATDQGFAVADDGPGIPPDDRERVLEWGYSTDGTGVGLGVVALVAERHGWSVDVTESETGGARFEFDVS
jgi:anti-sigma regulatory factor (Ser/Thr protein kinase)